MSPIRARCSADPIRARVKTVIVMFLSIGTSQLLFLLTEFLMHRIIFDKVSVLSLLPDAETSASGNFGIITVTGQVIKITRESLQSLTLNRLSGHIRTYPEYIDTAPWSPAPIHTNNLEHSAQRIRIIVSTVISQHILKAPTPCIVWKTLDIRNFRPRLVGGNQVRCIAMGRKKTAGEFRSVVRGQ